MDEFIKKDLEQRSKRGVSVNDVVAHVSEQNADQIVVISKKNGQYQVSNSTDNWMTFMELLHAGYTYFIRLMKGGK